MLLTLQMFAKQVLHDLSAAAEALALPLGTLSSISGRKIPRQAPAMAAAIMAIHAIALDGPIE
jgi:hypothetical protein